MKQHILTGIIAIALASGARAAEPKSASAGKPNVLFIVADDMGYGDCGFNGCRDIPTPNIDSLAASGVRFTNGYVTGCVCSPTRAALMTGRDQHRDGVPTWITSKRRGLNAGVPTVADYLKRAGYRTMLIGKWHLGEEEFNHPLNRGFNEFFGFLGGHRTYWPDKSKAKHKSGEAMMRDHKQVKLPEYSTHAFGSEAVKFLHRQRGKTQPFFLYLAFNAVHTPMEAPGDYLKRFKDIQEKKRRTYAGMLAAMDDNIGDVLKALREDGFEENTLVYFISDNGGPITRNSPNASRNSPLRGGKGDTLEGGIHVPFVVKWPARLKPGTTYAQPVIQMDVTATVIALAGQTPDPKWPIDGVNLLPFLTGEQTGAPHDTLCWEYGQQWAIRQGPWKLTCALSSKTAEQPTLGLFDLSKDIGEKHNLVFAHPERVNQLRAQWNSWHKAVVGDKPSKRIDIKDVNNAP